MTTEFVYDDVLELRAKDKCPNMVPLLKSLNYGDRQFISFYSRFDYEYRLYDTIPKEKTPFGYIYFYGTKNNTRDEWDATKKSWFGHKVKPILIDDAHELSLPLGHPQLDVLYVAHPLHEDVYYPAANFHPNTLETKYFELINLLTSLGAKEIEVEYLKGLKKDSTFNAEVDLGAFNSSTSGNSSKSNTTNIVYRASLEGKEPALPVNLHWYKNEISWQQLAHDRINNGLKEFELAVEYNDDFGVDGFIKAEIKKGSLWGKSLEFGGKYTSHENTVWKIKGKF